MKTHLANYHLPPNTPAKQHLLGNIAIVLFYPKYHENIGSVARGTVTFYSGDKNNSQTQSPAYTYQTATKKVQNICGFLNKSVGKTGQISWMKLNLRSSPTGFGAINCGK